MTRKITSKAVQKVQTELDHRPNGYSWKRNIWQTTQNGRR